mmetsp:Transcript_10950/g.23162  ORF Transcript_10950/g.23162 Transcript_10950/m.23162 type:complete len:150 (-) Transcript_10950:351-800(-)
MTPKIVYLLTLFQTPNLDASVLTARHQSLAGFIECSGAYSVGVPLECPPELRLHRPTAARDVPDKNVPADEGSGQSITLAIPGYSNCPGSASINGCNALQRMPIPKLDARTACVLPVPAGRGERAAIRTEGDCVPTTSVSFDSPDRLAV